MRAQKFDARQEIRSVVKRVRERENPRNSTERWLTLCGEYMSEQGENRENRLELPVQPERFSPGILGVISRKF